MLSGTIELLSFIWRGLGAVIIVIIVAIHGLEDNGPAWWEDGLVNVEIVSFEGEASKDGGDSNCLAIG